MGLPQMHPSQGTYSCDRSPSRGWRHFKTIACSANKSTSFASAASCSRRRSPVSPTTCMHYFECAERVTQSVALQGNESVHWYLVSDSMRVGGAAWWLLVATCCTQAGPACDVADANGNAEQPALIAFWTAVMDGCRCAGLQRSTTAASCSPPLAWRWSEHIQDSPGHQELGLMFAAGEAWLFGLANA